MRFFAFKRTSGNQADHFKGVETPSQMRFVHYMDKIVNKYNKKMPKERILNLSGIKLTILDRNLLFHLLYYLRSFQFEKFHFKITKIWK
jgi:hypothetical protein